MSDFFCENSTFDALYLKFEINDPMFSYVKMLLNTYLDKLDLSLKILSIYVQKGHTQINAASYNFIL